MDVVQKTYVNVGLMGKVQIVTIVTTDYLLISYYLAHLIHKEKVENGKMLECYKQCTEGFPPLTLMYIL